MVAKPRFLLLVGIGGACAFIGAFLAPRFLSGPPGPAQAETAPSATQPPPEAAPPSARHAATTPVGWDVTLSQLAEDLRKRLDQCEAREKRIQTEEVRLETVRDAMRLQRQSMEELRTQIDSKIEALRTEHEALLRTNLVLKQSEAANLKQIAAIYDCMDSADAARILAELHHAGRSETAVKTLSLMRDRSAARVLAAMTDSAMASEMSELLRQIQKEP